MIIYFLVIALISAVVLAMTLGARVRNIRRGEQYIYHPESLYQMVAPKIDTLADLIVSGVEKGLHFLYCEAVLRSHGLLTVIKSAVIKVEARFAHVADSIHGRGHITKKGSASFFLREISGGK